MYLFRVDTKKAGPQGPTLKNEHVRNQELVKCANIGGMRLGNVCVSLHEGKPCILPWRMHLHTPR